MYCFSARSISFCATSPSIIPQCKRNCSNSHRKEFFGEWLFDYTFDSFVTCIFYKPRQTVIISKNKNCYVVNQVSDCPHQWEVYRNNFEAFFVMGVLRGRFYVRFCDKGVINTFDPLVYCVNVPPQDDAGQYANRRQVCLRYVRGIHLPIPNQGGQYGNCLARRKHRHYLRTALVACDQWLANIAAGIRNEPLLDE